MHAKCCLSSFLSVGMHFNTFSVFGAKLQFYFLCLWCARSLTVHTPRSSLCALRIKGIGNKNEIKKFITVEWVAENIT